MDNWINLVPLILTALAGFVLVVSDRWQTLIISLGAIYLLAFSIFVQYLPFTFSLAKLITGLMALIILGLAKYKKETSEEIKPKSAIIFRIAALTFLYLLIGLSTKAISVSISIPFEIVMCSLSILVCGILQLGMTQKPFNVMIAILTFFLGFEIIYSVGESSLLVSGLMAVVNLLIAMVGSYIIGNAPEIES
jgi:hypothetical protein